jgi:hypothetical protein
MRYSPPGEAGVSVERRATLWRETPEFLAGNMAIFSMKQRITGVCEPLPVYEERLTGFRGAVSDIFAFTISPVISLMKLALISLEKVLIQ